MNKYDYYNYATKALVYKAQGNISSAKKTYVEAAQMADFSNKITKGSEYYKRAIDLEFPEPKFNSLVSFLALFGISV
jgi:hypothetical protein